MNVDQEFQIDIYLFSFEGVMNIFNISGDNGIEVPPVPIPNTEVKLYSADDTWWETARESRSLPDNIFLNSSVGRACGC